MSKFKLALGLHNHQPVGNFDSVFEEAHTLAYLPFINLLRQFSAVKLSLHQSGILWDWQEKHHPDYFDLIKEMVHAGCIELMTGGFYEPILPSIPDVDKLGQIDLLNRYLRRHFGARPNGLWLTERVWEPHLPGILSKAGIEYLPVDDTHFLYAGFEIDDLRGIFVTEEAGCTIKLLPIQKRLRYLVPFAPVKKVVEELKRQAERDPEGLAVYADDGEKFGVWPKTNQHCYTDGWLERFFEALCANGDWLEVITLGEAAQTESMGQAYLPTASYAEMLHWSLPAKAFMEYEELERWLKEHESLERYERFIRGGHWRGFLTKYDEANLMHKRMLMVSRLLEQFICDHPERAEVIDQARRHLYAAQCNCPYWHGVFGGLYLPHLRQAIFENIIKAEKLLAEKSKKVLVSVYDCDSDGRDEIVVRSSSLAAMFKPSAGGMLVELDSYENNFNLTDTLSRRREGYHRKLANAQRPDEVIGSDDTASIHDIVWTKEEGLDKLLTEDWHLKRCFIDHFLGPQASLEGFQMGQISDEGDYVLGCYEIIQDTGTATVVLRRRGHLWRFEGSKSVILEKRFYFGAGSETVSVNYLLTAEHEDISGVRLAVENNFNFQAGHADDRYVLYNGKRKEDSYLDAIVTHTGCHTVVLRDDWRRLAVAMSFDKKAEVWQVPIFTISLSEGGFEKVYQGTSLASIFTTDLKRGVPFEVTIMLFAGKIENMPRRFFRAGTEVAVGP
ncbi:MAG: DUF1926 domain-containing protein [Candidatus Zixiibacteriota bacterium]|nr:MAG: DUF1926 domain-containing protein [candidate division Zixibacteria bacterium]